MPGRHGRHSPARATAPRSGGVRDLQGTGASLKLAARYTVLQPTNDAGRHPGQRGNVAKSRELVFVGLVGGPDRSHREHVLLILKLKEGFTMLRTASWYLRREPSCRSPPCTARTLLLLERRGGADQQPTPAPRFTSYRVHHSNSCIRAAERGAVENNRRVHPSRATYGETECRNQTVCMVLELGSPYQRRCLWLRKRAIWI